MLKQQQKHNPEKNYNEKLQINRIWEKTKKYISTK